MIKYSPYNCVISPPGNLADAKVQGVEPLHKQRNTMKKQHIYRSRNRGTKFSSSEVIWIKHRWNNLFNLLYFSWQEVGGLITTSVTSAFLRRLSWSPPNSTCTTSTKPSGESHGYTIRPSPEEQGIALPLPGDSWPRPQCLILGSLFCLAKG